MAKALKIAAVVVGVAGLALVTGGLAAGASLSFVLGASAGVAGLTVGGLFTAAALLSTGASLLSPRPKVPETSAANADRLTVSINTRAPRVTVVGSTAMATDLRDQEWSADQSYLHRFVVVASHRVAAIREIWFDDKLAWTLAGGVQGDFAGFLDVTPVLEGSPDNAIYIGPRMGGSRRYTGCAYVYLRYKLSKNGKTDSPFASSVPSRMTIVGDGAAFYDPRLDSTVPGGSGPMRADDQSTWAWNPSACRNPALAMLFYLLGWRIRNPATGAWKKAVGKGIPAARIDLASFITAANLCDETVSRANGTAEPRYRCDGVWSEQDDTSLVLENLKATMNAVVDDVDGKIRVTVLHNDLAAPIGQLTAADVQGAFTWTQTPALSDCVNVLRGGYTDPSNTALYQLVDFPEARIDSPDGIDRAQTLNLPLVQSPSQAQRLVKTRLQRSQYPGSFQATFLSTAWRYQKGDVIEFSFYPLGWDRKLFRIADMATQVDGLVPMLLREEHASIYAFDGTEVGAVQGAEPTRYDPSLWPLVKSIADAGKTADWPSIADPDGTKPAPNADVTGENTSKDTNAVGGKPATTVLDEIAAMQARADAIDHDTIPAINKAVSDVDGRVATARKDASDALAAAEARLADADAIINRRIDSVAAEGGYDDTYIRGEITRVDETAITREGAISRRIDDVQSSFTAAKGITPNADFGAGAANWTTGGFTFPSYGAGRLAQSVAGQHCTLQTGLVKVVDTGRGMRLHCTFTLYGPAQVTYVGLQMYGAGGNFVGNVYSENVHAMLPAGTYTVDQLYIGLWPDTGAVQYLIGDKFIPGVNVVQGLFLANYPGDNGPVAGGYVQIHSFWLEEVGTAQLTNAKVDEVARTAADATKAAADLSTSVDTRFTGVNLTLGGFDQRITGLSTDLEGYAGRTEALEAVARGGGNLVPNTAFGTLDGWALTFNAGGLATMSLNAAGEPVMIGGVENNLSLTRTPAGNGLCAEAQSARFAVRPGSFLQFYALTANHRSNVWTSLFFFRVDNSYQGYAGEFMSPRINEGGKNIVSWDMTGSKAVRVPDDAVYACFVFRLYNVSADGYGWMSRPFVTEVQAGTNTWAPYAPGNDRTVTGAVSARVKATEDALANLPNQYAAASRTAALEAQVNLAADSGLQRAVNARIEDRATAIADAKAGAVAETVSILRGEYNGTFGEVNRQAGVLVDLQGKATAYVKVVADAGNGRAAFSLWSDQFGGKWALTGDGIITGGVIVDGSIIASGSISAAQIKINGVDIFNLDRSTMTSASSAQSAALTSASAALTYATGFSGSLRVRPAGTLFAVIDAYSGATDSSDQVIYNSFDLFNSGGQLVASTALPYGGFSGRLTNYLIRIPNTYGDDTLTWRIGTRRNANTGQYSSFGSGSVTVNWTAL